VIRRVGLDLDNTIIDYTIPLNAALDLHGYVASAPLEGVLSKEIAKQVVLERDGDEGWQRVQGWIYSTGIDSAEAFPGVHEFLVRCSIAGDEVHIVSHKTEFGHFDTSGRSLRDAAMSWLVANDVVGDEPWQVAPSRVYFESTQDDKITRIIALGISVYVDDLSEVLSHPNFPIAVRGLKFGSQGASDGLEIVGSWREVADAIHGPFGSSDVTRMLGSLGAVNGTDSAQVLGGGGNSRVFVLDGTSGKTVAKRYPDRHHDRRNRCRTEVRATLWMHDHGLPVTKPLWWDDRMGLATFEWVAGTPSPTPDSDLINAMLAMTERLLVLSNDVSLDFEDASEACLSLDDLVRQVRFRIDSAIHSEWTPISELAINRLQKEFDEAVALATLSWPVAACESLPRDERMLSPSDFGSHNVIRGARGDVFVDFEYFGWDDPAKLVGDVLLHPGMSLDHGLRQQWWQGAEAVFGRRTMERARTALPLLALRWHLIILRTFFGSGPFDESSWSERYARAEGVRSIALEWNL